MLFRSEEYFIGSFISGLNNELQSSVQMLKPSSLNDAFQLAQLQEKSFQALLSKHKPKFFPSFKHPTPPTSSNYKTIPSLSFSKPTPVPHQILPSHPIDKKPFPRCYRCGDRYFQGHRCSTKQLHFIKTDEKHYYSADSTSSGDDDDEGTMDQGTCHALDSKLPPNTIKIMGKVNSKEILILIDSGSNHSFLHSVLAKELGCRLLKASPIQLSVANSQKLINKIKTKGFTWSIQNHSFSTTVRVMELGEFSMVLVVDWMLKYNSVYFNFK